MDFTDFSIQNFYPQTIFNFSVQKIKAIEYEIMKKV